MQTHHRAPVLRFSDHPSTAEIRREDPRVTVVVVTHDRPRELAGILRHLRLLPEQPRLVVLDNASPHSVAVAQIASLHGADVVRSEHHLGAAACNQVVASVTTPHVAFCDDGTWWSEGSLQRACDLMDEYPHIGAINGRVLVGSRESEHPACERMQRSPLDNTGLPGPALLSFMSNAVVMRTRAFRHAQGYEPQAFCGAEEALIGLSLAALGWRIVYVQDVTMHQLPAVRDSLENNPTLVARNRLWVAWLRMPWPEAWRETRAVLSAAWREGRAGPVLWHSLKPLSWLVLRRRSVPDHVVQMHRIARLPTDASGRLPAKASQSLQRTSPPSNMPPC